jgi:hypothetical protein
MANENGKRISKSEMDKMHKKYKEKKSFATESVYFDRATFHRLMTVPGTFGVRVYYGVNDKDELHPMFVPVDEEGKNIYTDSEGSTIEEYGNPCPPFCPPE